MWFLVNNLNKQFMVVTPKLQMITQNCKCFPETNGELILECP